MLRQIGVVSIENLFDSIPEDLRLRQDLRVPAALSELELLAKFEQTATRNPASGCSWESRNSLTFFAAMSVRVTI